MIADAHEQDTRRYRGVSTVKPIDAAKEAVPTIDLADRLVADRGGRWCKVGSEWTTNCVLPDHEDRSPSFTVNPEKNVFFCHGCLRGGDVVTLAQLAWGYDERDMAMVAANLLHEFGHEIPARPPAWHRKQERQKLVRSAVKHTVKANYKRQVFKYCILPNLMLGGDEGEREAEISRVWAEFETVMNRMAR